MTLRRVFTMQDQKNFASFSGDYNPIHVDHSQSIRTHAGQPIVHGVHLLLWALDSFKIDLNNNTKISIKFISQVILENEVQASLNREKNKILLYGKDKIEFCIIEISNLSSKNNTKVNNNEIIFNIFHKQQPDDLEIDEIKINKKIFDLNGGVKNLGKNIFPYLIKNNGLDFVYEIACISSIVGMKVPGKHSLFLNLNLDFSDNKKDKYFIVNNKHSTLKLISISYYGLNVNAEIKALFRPKPTHVSSIKDLKKEFNKQANLKGKKVLVIGGSRGIGAYITKLCSIMGASVTFSYNSQIKEAKLIEKEILNDGGDAKCLKINVLNNIDIKMLEVNFDHVYYFATPKILSNSSLDIDKKMVSNYHLFYVDSFKNLIEKFNSLNKKSKFLYPSTTFIDNKKDGFREYISAKLEGEKLCNFYNNKNCNIKILYPRIPPLDTDQNLSILPTKNAKTSKYALDMINSMIKHDDNYK